MKHFVLALCLVITMVNAQEWRDVWISGMECLEDQRWEQAEDAFDQAISMMEQEGDTTSPHIYVDRARLYCCLGRYEEAFRDVTIALQSSNLTRLDRSAAILVRQQVHVNEGRMDKAIEDMNEFRDTYPNIPKMEFTKGKVYIRNMPNCKCSLAMVKAYLLASGLCDSEKDMKLLPSGLFIATVKPGQCGCGCTGDGDESHEEIKQDLNELAVSCPGACDTFAASGQAWCGTGFSHNYPCLMLCAATVELLRQRCHTCCSSGNFYQNCLKPFEDILGAMGKGCDPLWD